MPRLEFTLGVITAIVRNPRKNLSDPFTMNWPQEERSQFQMY